MAASSALTAFGSVMCPDHADRLLSRTLNAAGASASEVPAFVRPEKAFGSYRDKLEYQARQMERTPNLPLGFRKPTSGLRFTQTGLELIRNPVVLENSSQIDDQITREVRLKNRPA